MERHILIGSEDVITGGRMTRDAAETMQRAASTILEASERLIGAHEEFLTRLDAILLDDREKRGIK